MPVLESAQEPVRTQTKTAKKAEDVAAKKITSELHLPPVESLADRHSFLDESNDSLAVGADGISKFDASFSLKQIPNFAGQDHDIPGCGGNGIEINNSNGLVAAGKLF